MTEQAFLQDVSSLMVSRIRRSSGQNETALQKALDYINTTPGGKLIRPRLVYLSSLIAQLPPEELIPAAASAELLHTASLIHDDVIDRGQLRRGRLCTHREHGIPQAILAGDYLVMEALSLLIPYPHDLVNRALDASKRTIEAVALEQETPIKTDRIVWETIARGKTGELFGWCLGSGPASANREKEFDELYTLGKKIGVLFQALDDAKDHVGVATGKEHGQDSKNGSPNLYAIVGPDEFFRYQTTIKREIESSMTAWPLKAREKLHELIQLFYNSLPEGME